MVRDPWTRAVSAYMEIIFRLTTRGMPKPLKGLIDEKDATKRFTMFLDAMQGGRPIGKEGFHAWPEALLIDVIADRGDGTRFDAIVRIENITEELPEVLHFAGAEKVSLGSSKNDHHSHSNSSFVNEIRATDETLMRIFCELYEVDYVCFPSYAPPAICLDLNPTYAQGCQVSDTETNVVGAYREKEQIWKPEEIRP
eukprot:CAMPEP_0185759394 /NCGR_PEP_ID=MMETSP1174-20130828/18142_1 /TAXON_ID=35687 /ORGANISM="Dictyocha speculum, Strain CCMP1381" /LENGTH=196 /DNA_ID=CAMNT_0028439717 /DNA_START=583 /DNA_END=1174 /DNA_ORIENTATION=+